MTKANAVLSSGTKSFSGDEVRNSEKTYSKLEKLATQEQIRFILDKCKVMNTGRNNLSYRYILMDSELAVIS